MATYATVADFEAYVEGWTTTDEEALERILERAERDVDRVLGPIARDPDTGLKLDPDDLTTLERAALARAVSAQAYHRITHRGEGTGGVEPARKRIKGPDFEVEFAEAASTGTDGNNRLAPELAEELEPLSYLRPRGARARP